MGALQTAWTWVSQRAGLHIALGVALIALAFGVSFAAERLATNWIADAAGQMIPAARKAVCDDKSQKNVAEVLLPGLKTYKATDAERDRIAAQAFKAQRLECLHMALLENYVSNYYIAVLMGMLFGGIAAVSLLLVGPKGWTQSNQYLVNVLIVSGAIAAFYGSFPGVFQQPLMVTAHKMQVLRYEALLDGMASQVASPKTVPAVCAKPPPEPPKRVLDDSYSVALFIVCNDAALALADLPFGLDPTTKADYQAIVAPKP